MVRDKKNKNSDTETLETEKVKRGAIPARLIIYDLTFTIKRRKKIWHLAIWH